MTYNQIKSRTFFSGVLVGALVVAVVGFIFIQNRYQIVGNSSTRACVRNTAGYENCANDANGYYGQCLEDGRTSRTCSILHASRISSCISAYLCGTFN